MNEFKAEIVAVHLETPPAATYRPLAYYSRILYRDGEAIFVEGTNVNSPISKGDLAAMEGQGSILMLSLPCEVKPTKAVFVGPGGYVYYASSENPAVDPLRIVVGVFPRSLVAEEHRISIDNLRQMLIGLSAHDKVSVFGTALRNSGMAESLVNEFKVALLETLEDFEGRLNEVQSQLITLFKSKSKTLGGEDT